MAGREAWRQEGKGVVREEGREGGGRVQGGREAEKEEEGGGKQHRREGERREEGK